MIVALFIVFFCVSFYLGASIGFKDGLKIGYRDGCRHGYMIETARKEILKILEEK